MFNILVVEDNRDLRELLCDALTGEGYRAYSSSDGNEALTRLEETFFDLIIADIMMPNMDGLQLTEELRRAGIDTPILIVTARDDYETLQSGFTLGADDYMVKPVNVNELLLRVKALLRRAKINTDKKITVGSTVLDFETMSVAVKEEKTELPLKEFQLLFKLLSYPDKIFTRQQLMDEIWGLDSDTYDRTLNTHINRLRERFSDNKDFQIVTIRGLGYKAVKKNEQYTKLKINSLVLVRRHCFGSHACDVCCHRRCNGAFVCARCHSCATAVCASPVYDADYRQYRYRHRYIFDCRAFYIAAHRQAE